MPENKDSLFNADKLDELISKLKLSKTKTFTDGKFNKLNFEEQVNPKGVGYVGFINSWELSRPYFEKAHQLGIEMLRGRYHDNKEFRVSSPSLNKGIMEQILSSEYEIAKVNNDFLEKIFSNAISNLPLRKKDVVLQYTIENYNRVIENIKKSVLGKRTKPQVINDLYVVGYLEIVLYSKYKESLNDYNYYLAFRKEDNFLDFRRIDYSVESYIKNLTYEDIFVRSLYHKASLIERSKRLNNLELENDIKQWLDNEEYKQMKNGL